MPNRKPPNGFDLSCGRIRTVTHDELVALADAGATKAKLPHSEAIRLLCLAIPKATEGSSEPSHVDLWLTKDTRTLYAAVMIRYQGHEWYNDDPPYRPLILLQNTTGTQARLTLWVAGITAKKALIAHGAPLLSLRIRKGEDWSWYKDCLAGAGAIDSALVDMHRSIRFLAERPVTDMETYHLMVRSWYDGVSNRWACLDILGDLHKEEQDLSAFSAMERIALAIQSRKKGLLLWKSIITLKPWALAHFQRTRHLDAVSSLQVNVVPVE